MNNLKKLPLLFLLTTLVSCQKEDTLKGLDKESLFALPTSEELTSVRAEWQKRDLTPSEFKIEETHEITSNKIYLHFISFRLNGYKQYAGVLVPITSEPLPVQLFVYGFKLDEPVTYNTIKIKPLEAPGIPYIYIVPALRGQQLSLTINDVNYKTPFSEGVRNDAFDGATDDAIACLNAVTANFKEANVEKVFVKGGSRGGTVALLMAERDKRIKLAVGVAFPSDLISLTKNHQNDPTYKFQFLDDLIDYIIPANRNYYCEQDYVLHSI